MVGRLALSSGDLKTAAAAMDWACQLDPSNPVFRQARQGVLRRRDRRRATAELYREAMETAGEVFGRAHPLVALVADGFAEDWGGFAGRRASRDRCRHALSANARQARDGGTTQPRGADSGMMPQRARRLCEPTDRRAAED